MQVQLDTNICICSSISFRSRMVFFFYFPSLTSIKQYRGSTKCCKSWRKEIIIIRSQIQKKKENKKKRNRHNSRWSNWYVCCHWAQCAFPTALFEWMNDYVQYNIIYILYVYDHMKIYIHREVMSSLLHMVIYLLAGVMFKIDRSVPTSSLEK